MIGARRDELSRCLDATISHIPWNLYQFFAQIKVVQWWNRAFRTDPKFYDKVVDVYCSFVLWLPTFTVTQFMCSLKNVLKNLRNTF